MQEPEKHSQLQAQARCCFKEFNQPVPQTARQVVTRQAEAKLGIHVAARPLKAPLLETDRPGRPILPLLATIERTEIRDPRAPQENLCGPGFPSQVLRQRRRRPLRAKILNFATLAATLRRQKPPEIAGPLWPMRTAQSDAAKMAAQLRNPAGGTDACD